MRYGPLVAVLAISATAVSGCQTTTPDIDTSGGTGGTGGTSTFGGTTSTGTTTTGTTDPTGSTTGTSTGQAVSNGSTSYVFNDGGASITGAAGTVVTIANPGGGLNNETASVAVSTANSDMSWADPITMPLFSTTQTIPAGVPALGGTYAEYRQIDTDTDAELQVWQYTHSRLGQYAVWFDATAPNNNNVALFYDGDATPEASMPTTATATYNGNFGGVAVASNWNDRERAVADPFDTDEIAGEVWSPNGTWRVTGNSRIVADFGAGTVTGTLDTSTWRQFVGSPTSPDGYITITPNETTRPFRNYTMNGTIVGNSYTGSVRGPIGSVVTGDNSLNGGFFGPNAEETAGVFRSQTTSPQPSDGISPNEENRRGFIDIRGVFQGQ